MPHGIRQNVPKEIFEKLKSINSVCMIQLRKVLTVCNLNANVIENMDLVNLTLCKARLWHDKSENWKRDFKNKSKLRFYRSIKKS